jgi:CRP-like cAMP-binding protein
MLRVNLPDFVSGRDSFVSKKKTAFDPKIFLAKVGDGKAISQYQKDQIVFSQGDIADAVFYIQKGRIKLTVVSERGKEAVVGILEPRHFLAKGVSMVIRCASQQRLRSINR